MIAPEFARLRGWLNSPPLTTTSLRGKVVLLDFWTYSCVNCIRTLPHMKQLHAQYSGEALALIGVHTPEFEFEKVPENVADAVKRFGIEYPVAIDSENATWKRYGNRYWPRQTLIDMKGRIRWEHTGEGDYDKMKDQIRLLLREAGSEVKSETGSTATSHTRESSLRAPTALTPEIYTGSLRSESFGNGQVCVPGSCTRYIDSGSHQDGTVYFEGAWTQFPEYVVHAASDPGYALLKYTASNANAVLGVLDHEPVRVEVDLDGRPVVKDQAGSDISWDSKGSYVTVRAHRLYDIVRTRQPETCELKIVTTSDKLCLYTYTFG